MELRKGTISRGDSEEEGVTDHTFGSTYRTLLEEKLCNRGAEDHPHQDQEFGLNSG